MGPPVIINPTANFAKVLRILESAGSGNDARNHATRLGALLGGTELGLMELRGRAQSSTTRASGRRDRSLTRTRNGGRHYRGCGSHYHRTVLVDPDGTQSSGHGTAREIEVGMRKNVCVIGAGPSGLVATKELLDENHSVTCFEHSAGPGGMFRAGVGPDEPGSSSDAHHGVPKLSPAHSWPTACGPAPRYHRSTGCSARTATTKQLEKQF
jgi:hypothetical protein